MHFIPHPYLDPGSGSFLIQLAIAAALDWLLPSVLPGGRSKVGLELNQSPKKTMTTRKLADKQRSPVDKRSSPTRTLPLLSGTEAGSCFLESGILYDR